MATLYGTLLQPVSLDECKVTPRTVVHVGDDGRIASVGADKSPPPEAVGDDACWILPGFVDAHLHVAQWDRRGIDGLPLFKWQERIGFPAEMRMADPAAATAMAEQFASAIVAGGTTCILAFGTSFAAEVEATFAVFARRGLRATYGLTLNDTGVPQPMTQSPDQALDQSRQLAARWNGAEGGRLRYAFSPRSSVYCSEQLMRGAAALADMLKCCVQTHIAESRDEVSRMHQLYPDQVDEVDLFAEMGLLGPRTILAHGLLLNHQQRREVAQAGTALVHCPVGNLFRGSGLMDIVAHRAAGISIALGSSIAGGFEPFMPRVAVEALQTAKAIQGLSPMHRAEPVPTPAEAWWTLTAGGAAAIGLGRQVGQIAPGYQADCLVVRPEKWIADLPPQQQVSALLYTISPQQIEHVLIAGRRVGP